MTEPTTTDELIADPQPGDADDTLRITTPCMCGYDLRGLSRAGRCPECGEDIAAALRCHANALGPSAVVRRMMRGLIVVLAAYLAWLVVLVVRGLLEGGDRWAYWVTGVSGIKTFIVPPAFITHRPEYVIPWLIPVCHVVHLVGVLFLTTPPAPGRAPALRWRAITLRWASVATVPLLALGFLLWRTRFQAMLGWLSVADSIIGLAWGLYLVGLARSVGRARWLSIGGWVVAIGSMIFGPTFASAFLVMTPTQGYWERLLWAALGSWAAIGLLCTVLLALTWFRLRRDLRTMIEAEHG